MEPTAARPALPWAVVGVAAWAAVVVVARWWGLGVADDERLALGGAPVVGTWRWEPTARLWVPVVVAGAVVALAPVAARRLPWPAVVGGTWALAAGWATALAATDPAGLAAVARPLGVKKYEYLAVVRKVGDPGWFVDRFVDLLRIYPTHVKGHPPGMVLLLWAMDRVGLGGTGWAAVLVVGGGGLAAAAAAVALREVAGEAAARRAVPFLAVVPAAVWVATSADAFFAGVTAVGVALVVVATGRAGRRGDACAVAGGVVLGWAVFLGYGAAPLVVVPVAVAVARRRWRVLAGAAAGGGAVVAAFLAAGFWWFDGLAATRELYESGVARRRPFAYFALAGNPGALALALGPAAVVAAARLRDRRVWLLAGPAAVAVLAADLSGLSKGEVERIWLPFVPWLLVATAVLGGRWAARGWLAVQAGAAIVVQAWLVTPW